MKKIVFLAFAIVVCACSKYYIPEPDDHHYTGPAANATISMLEQYWQDHGNGNITDDIIIKCVVAGNDMEGNVERQLMVQDSTGGCILCIDAPYLYRHYVIGQELYVHCRNMYVKEDEKGLQLGMYRYYADSIIGLFEGLYEQQCSQYVYLSENIYDITSHEIYAIAHCPEYMNTLVTVPQVLFHNGGNIPFADNNSNVTYHAMSVNDGVVWMRVSPLAWFASDVLPHDTCSVTGVLGVENGLWCVTPRNRADIKPLQK